MVAFGHTAVGVIIGATTYKYLGQGNLVEGLLITGTASFISHYVMDAIPHGHFFMPKGYKKGIMPIIIFDLLLSIILFLGMVYLKDGFGDKLFYIMFGIGGSQLPDVIEGLIYINLIKAKGLLKMEKILHESVHWHDNNSKILLIGILDLWQVLVVLIAFFII